MCKLLQLLILLHLYASHALGVCSHVLVVARPVSILGCHRLRVGWVLQAVLQVDLDRSVETLRRLQFDRCTSQVERYLHESSKHAVLIFGEVVLCI
jgi:hypothetical protein